MVSASQNIWTQVHLELIQFIALHFRVPRISYISYTVASALQVAKRALLATMRAVAVGYGVAA